MYDFCPCLKAVGNLLGNVDDFSDYFPHPGNIIKLYAMKQVFDTLQSLDLIHSLMKMANTNTISYDGFTGTVNYSQEAVFSSARSKASMALSISKEKP